MKQAESEMMVKQLKENVFHKYIDKRVINYPVSREGQTIDTYLEIKNTGLDIHLKELTDKYGFKKSWSDIQTEYVFQVFNSIQKFEPETDIDEEQAWESILKGTDELLENQLLKYIRVNAGFKMWEYANPDAFRSTTTVDGERLHYTLVMEMEGLDNLLTGNFEDNTPIQLTDENAMFDSTIYSYYMTYFQRWFNKNKESFLVESQLQFLEDLKKLSKDYHLTAEEFEETTGVKWQNYSKRLRTIENSIKRAWEEEQPVKKSRRQVSLEPKIKYAEGFMKLYEEMLSTDEDLNTQNIRLTDYLYKGMYDKKVEYEVFQITNKVFNLDELILFNRITNNKNEKRVSLRAVSLVKVANGMEELLQSLLGQYEEEINFENNSPAPINPNAPLPEKIDRIKSEVITYNSKGLITGRQIKLIEAQERFNNIYFLLPTGAISKQRP